MRRMSAQTPLWIVVIDASLNISTDCVWLQLDTQSIYHQFNAMETWTESQTMRFHSVDLITVGNI